MFNLLPSESKIAIRKEFKLRLAVVSLVALFVGILIATILLVPSYFFSKSTEKEVLANKGIVERSFRSEEGESLNIELNQTRETLALLVPDMTLSVSDVINKIITIKGQGISISKLEYDVLADKTKQLQVAGRASDRDTLLSYKNKLTESKLFKSIDLPVSNFTDEADIEFNLSLEGAF